MKSTAILLSLRASWQQSIQINLSDMAALLEAPDLPLSKRVKLVRSGLKCSIALLRLAPRALQQCSCVLAKRICSVRRSLRKARDTQALFESLDDLRLSRRPAQRAADLRLVDEWRSRLNSQQTVAMRLVTQKQIASETRRLRRLSAIVAQMKDANDQDEDIVHRFRQDYRRARRRMSAVLADGRPAELHHFRQAVVNHRYQLQLFLPNAVKRLRELEQLRRALGAFQDLEILKEAVRENPEASDPERLCRLIERRQRKRLRRAEGLSDPLFSQKTKRAWPADPVFYGSDRRATLVEGSPPAEQAKRGAIRRTPAHASSG